MFRPQLGPWPLVLAIIPWVLRRWITGRWGVKNPFLAPLALFALSAGIGVWAAYDQAVALAKFWLIVGAIFLFFTLSHWLTNDDTQDERKRVTTLIWMVSFLGAFAALYFIVTNDWDQLPTKNAWLESMGKALQTPIPGSLKALNIERIHRNVMAGMLAVLVPFAAGSVWIASVRKETLSQVVGIATLVVILVGLVLTASRGAWLALGTAVVLVIWWQIAKRLADITQGRRTIWFLGGPLLVAGITGFVLVIRPSLLAQFLTIWTVPVSGLARADLYANSLTLVQDYIFTGGGLGGYMMQYSTYALLVHVGFSAHSHNLYLDLIIEQGILAIMALGWMWILVGKATWQSLNGKLLGTNPVVPVDTGEESGPPRMAFSSGGVAKRVLLGTAGLSLVVMSIHGLVDDPLYSSRGIVLMFIPLAAATPMTQQVETVRSDPRRLIAIIGVVILLVFGFAFWRPIMSQAQSNLAAVSQSKAELSVYRWPDYPIQDAVRREIDMNQVIAAYERAIDLYPANSSAHRRLGQIELSLGRYESALEHLELAYEGLPDERVTRRLLAEALAVNGRVEEGATISITVKDDLGQLDARRYWYGFIDDSFRRSAIDVLIGHRDGS